MVGGRNADVRLAPKAHCQPAAPSRLTLFNLSLNPSAFVCGLAQQDNDDGGSIQFLADYSFDEILIVTLHRCQEGAAKRAKSTFVFLRNKR